MILGAAIAVMPLSLAMGLEQRVDFFAVVLSFPIASRTDPHILVATLQYIRIYGAN